MTDLQEQIDDLVRHIKTNRGLIADLQDRADASADRADIAERRADAAELRADASQERADAAERLTDDLSARTTALEKQSAIDGAMIAELHQDGVLSQEHAAQMEAALKSSRVVGAAIGIVMNSRQVSEFEAFAVLKKASQDSNRKLRDIAADLVGSAESRQP